ncbi:MAG: YDG domain-containing protein, partial [Opitutaceae bacterium]
AANYSLVQPTNLTANITAANLLISGVGARNKIYDGTTIASLGGAAVVSAFSGDSVSVRGPGVGAFADQNAGVGKSVTVSGFTLSGADAGNYTAVQPANLTANITAPDLNVISALQLILVFNTLGQSGGNMLSSVADGRVMTFGPLGGRDERVGPGTTRSLSKRGVGAQTIGERLGSGVVVIDGGTKLPANRVNLQN